MNLLCRAALPNAMKSSLPKWIWIVPLMGLAFRAPQDDASALPSAGERAAQLQEAFARGGIHLDYEAGVCAIGAQVAIRDELLEYLLSLAYGAAHESMFVTEVEAEGLNAALLTLGVQPGRNAMWAPKVPAPTEEELRAGASAHDVTLPTGDGFYLYAAWTEGDESYLYRIEDLLRDLGRGRTMQRHRWVYLGSRMTERGPDHEVVFAATAEGNLINVAFFSQGYTLLTPALDSCVEQTIWLPNAWLLPEMHSPVLFVFSRERLTSLPPSMAARVPVVEPQPR